MWACAWGSATTQEGGSGMRRRSSIRISKIQTALADDSIDERQGQRRQHRDGGDRARRAGDEDRHAPVQLAVGGRDIEDAREKFGALSEAIDTYMNGLQLDAAAKACASRCCPMVKKPWLQKGDAIANPYYGKEM